MGAPRGRAIRRMPSGAELHARRCGNRASHAPHSWRGLNTRHAGYYCDGQVRLAAGWHTIRCPWCHANGHRIRRTREWLPDHIRLQHPDVWEWILAQAPNPEALTPHHTLEAR